MKNKMIERYFVRGIGVSRIDINEAIEYLVKYIKNGGGGYICFLNTRAWYYGVKNAGYKNIQNNSLMTFPDGKPLALIGNMQGFKNVNKVSGLEFLKKASELSIKEGYSHYFYGSTKDVIKKMTYNLKQKYPSIKIVGAVSPPFGEAEELAGKSVIDEINRVKPTFLWIGLGAPKQEIVASLLKKKLDNVLIVCVGLVFEYEAGTVKKPPEWVHDSYFEWLYRVFVQFSRTKNFVIPFIFMLRQIVVEFFANRRGR